MNVRRVIFAAVRPSLRPLNLLIYGGGSGGDKRLQAGTRPTVTAD